MGLGDGDRSFEGELSLVASDVAQPPRAAAMQARATTSLRFILSLPSVRESPSRGALERHTELDEPAAHNLGLVPLLRDRKGALAYAVAVAMRGDTEQMRPAIRAVH